MIPLRTFVPEWNSRFGTTISMNTRRCDSLRCYFLWWYHVNKYRAMRGNRSELAPVWKSPRCLVNIPLRRSSRSEHWIGPKKYFTPSLTNEVTPRRVSLCWKKTAPTNSRKQCDSHYKNCRRKFWRYKRKSRWNLQLVDPVLPWDQMLHWTIKQYKSSVFKHKLRSYFASHCVSSLKDFSCITLSKTSSLMRFHLRNEYYFRCRWF